MGMRYHISKQGVPRVCTAKPGNCPLGGEDNHYLTFEEAQAVSQEKFGNDFPLLPANSNGNDKPKKSGGLLSLFRGNKSEPKEEQSKEYELLPPSGDDGMSLSEEDSLDLAAAISSLDAWDMEVSRDATVEEKYNLLSSQDEELLQSILDGKIDASNNPKNIEVVLRNPNIPRDFVDRVISSPNFYSVETQRILMTNDSLTHEDLMNVVDRSDDMYARAIALRNPNLDVEFSTDFIKNREDELRELPWANMAENFSVDVETLKDFDLKRFKGEITIDEKTINLINAEYPRVYQGD